MFRSKSIVISPARVSEASWFVTVLLRNVIAICSMTGVGLASGVGSGEGLGVGRSAAL